MVGSESRLHHPAGVATAPAVGYNPCSAARRSRHAADAAIAQLDRASDYGSEGWGFESSWLHHPNSNPLNRLEEIDRDAYLGRWGCRCSIVVRGGPGAGWAGVGTAASATASVVCGGGWSARRRCARKNKCLRASHPASLAARLRWLLDWRVRFSGGQPSDSRSEGQRLDSALLLSNGDGVRLGSERPLRSPPASTGPPPPHPSR